MSHKPACARQHRFPSHHTGTDGGGRYRASSKLLEGFGDSLTSDGKLTVDDEDNAAGGATRTRRIVC